MTTVITYQDPCEGFSGWLVYDRGDCRIAAGGCRVQPGLTVDTLTGLAARMTLKERVLGLNVDGAKCGIDYDPHQPGKAAALRRFLAFLRSELMTRYSMGCDMGTRWDELEQIAVREGIPSVKYAVRQAQGLTEAGFADRIRLLDRHLGTLTLGQRRAGHALAQAAIEAARAAGRTAGWTCALQGFGNLGRAAAYSLIREGVRITAVADEYGCVSDRAGLDVTAMLAAPQGTSVWQTSTAGHRLHRDAVLDHPADVLVLAAGEDAMTPLQAENPRTPVVVVGANCGLRPQTEYALHQRGVLVVPDFIAGIGGSASMEALFGPRETPTPVQVLDGVTQIMRQLVDHLIDESRRLGRPLRDAAETLAAAARVDPAAAPYGCSPYLAANLTASVRARH